MPASRGNRRRRDPLADGPRLFLRGRYWAADLRPWGGERPTLRNPDKPASRERTELKDVARVWAEKYVARLRGAVHDRQRGIKPRRLLKDATAEYLRHRESTVERNTLVNDRTVTAHLVDAFGRRDVHAIGQDEIQRWFDDRARHYAPGTLRLYRIHMRGFFQWVGRPIEPVILLKGHKEDPDALRDEEVDALLDACRTDREHAVVRVGLATGARRAELWALEWPDFRKDGRSVRIQRQIAWPRTTTKGLKGKLNRTALVLPAFMDALPRTPIGRVVPGRVICAESASDVLGAVLTRAGLAKVGRGSHVLRHTYSRIGLEHYGWSLGELQVFLGHTSIATTEVYKHFGEEVAVKMAERRTYQNA